MTVGLLSFGYAPTAGGQWAKVKIGGGGYCTGLDTDASYTTFVCRTDTDGASIWNAATATWSPAITTSSFPNSPITNLDDRSGGVVEIRVAPSNPAIIYMSFQGTVWLSTNTGATWVDTGLTYSTRSAGQTESNNGANRYYGQKMAVDPANPDVVYYGAIGTSGGLWITRNGTSGASATWSQIPTATVPAGTGIYGIVIDQTSGTTTVSGATSTKIIYVGVYGIGVYQSTDGGVTWALLNSAGMPTSVVHARLGVDGILYCATNVSKTACLYSYNNTTSTWTNISPGSGLTNQIISVMPDPSDATRIVALGNDGHLSLGTSRGASWATQIGTISKTATLIPWLAASGIANISAADAMFDGSGNIWFAHGLGMSVTPFSGSPTSTVWDSNYTRGIENLTPNQVCLPPGGTPLLAGWDQGTFYINDPTAYTTSHSATNGGGASPFAIHPNWGVDWATSDPTFVAYVSVQGSTTDPFGYFDTTGGNTYPWTAFSNPSGGTIPIYSGSTAIKQGGCIACASPTNIIIVPANDSLPWYTKDQGATWTEIVLGTLPTSGTTGWGHSYTNTTISVAADRVTANCFYLFNYRYTSDGNTPAYTGTQSLYRSTDSGDTWVLMNSANIDVQASINYKLVSVPDNAGHLFLASGQTGIAGNTNPGATRLNVSFNSGATWAIVGAAGTADGAIKEPYCVGFGKAKAGNDYPSVVFVGWLYVSGSPVFGIWRSDNSAAEWAANTLTWTSIGTYPTQLGNIKTIDGSKDVYGVWYAGIGSGASYVYRTAD